MNENIKKMLDDFVVTLELSVRDVNGLLNALNIPYQTPTTAHVAYINMLTSQAGPQVEKAQKSLEEVAKAQDESKTTS